MHIRMIGYGRLAQAFIPQWQISHRVTVSSPSLQDGPISTNLYGRHSNTADVQDADVIVLAVKPALIPMVLAEIAPLADDTLIISFAAAVSEQTLRQYHQRICRVMPNIAAQVKASSSIALLNPKLSLDDQELIEALMLECGELVWVGSETDFDLATMISGCGPAFLYYFMQSMQAAAVDAGLDETFSSDLLVSSFAGALKLAALSPCDLEDLLQQVCSPNGVTAQGIDVFKKNHLFDSSHQAFQAALTKIKDLQNLAKS